MLVSRLKQFLVSMILLPYIRVNRQNGKKNKIFTWVVGEIEASYLTSLLGIDLMNCE